MTIVEGLKELKLIKKKIQKNRELIEKYSSQPSNEKPYFNTEKEQCLEIEKILQSSEDLVKNYLELHRRITETNLKVNVEFNGKSYSINSLIQIRHTLGMLIINTYQSLNDSNYRSTVSQYYKTSQSSEISLVRFYDEKKKQNKIRDWEDFYNSIDSRLETINATTNLVE